MRVEGRGFENIPLHYSFLIIHFTFLTIYFSRVTSIVSRLNKQCPAKQQAIPPPIASNAAGFCPQSPQVLPANQPSIACNPHEYCLHGSRAVQVLLASRTSVSHEPHKCSTNRAQQSCAVYGNNKHIIRRLKQKSTQKASIRNEASATRSPLRNAGIRLCASSCLRSCRNGSGRHAVRAVTGVQISRQRQPETDSPHRCA